MNCLFLFNDTYTNGYLSNTLNIISLLAILCGIFVISSKNPIDKSRKLMVLWDKLPNSGELLKLMVPSCS
jgi:hypothetical protein